MDLQFALICLQIVNILVSGCTPIISNFMQSITNSECCGLRIKRDVSDIISKRFTTRSRLGSSVPGTGDPTAHSGLGILDPTAHSGLGILGVGDNITH